MYDKINIGFHYFSTFLTTLVIDHATQLLDKFPSLLTVPNLPLTGDSDSAGKQILCFYQSQKFITMITKPQH